MDLDSSTIVNVFYADAVTAVTGKGDIEKLVASVSGVTYETKPNKISTTDGAKRPTEAEDDNDDDDWNDNWDSRPTVSLTVPNSSCTVLKGKELPINVNTNGSSVSASSNNTSIATVAVNGNSVKVTGVKEGTATITVTASRSGYYSRSISIAVTVTEKADDVTKITVNAPTEQQPWTTGNVEIIFTVNGKNINNVTVNNERVHADANSQYRYIAKANGDYTINATGQFGSDSKVVKVDKIDREKPQITDVVITETADVSKKSVSVKAEDKTSGIKTVVYAVDGTSTTLTTPNSEGRYVFEAVVGKAYTITATDNAGNTSDVKTVEIKSAVVSTPLAIEKCGCR